jgi:hypothetical protein
VPFALTFQRAHSRDEAIQIWGGTNLTALEISTPITSARRILSLVLSHDKFVNCRGDTTLTMFESALKTTEFCIQSVGALMPDFIRSILY